MKTEVLEELSYLIRMNGKSPIPERSFYEKSVICILDICLFAGRAIMASLMEGIHGTERAPFVYDKSVPWEQSSTLVIRYVYVVSIDRTSVGFSSWGNGTPGSKGFETADFIVIPSGKHILDIYFTAGIGQREQQTRISTTVTKDFLPGHTYLITQKAGCTDTASHEGVIFDVAEMQC